jgi:threonine aldolase
MISSMLCYTLHVGMHMYIVREKRACFDSFVACGYLNLILVVVSVLCNNTEVAYMSVK